MEGAGTDIDTDLNTDIDMASNIDVEIDTEQIVLIPDPELRPTLVSPESG